jgi:hypothetical protein
MSRIFNRLGFTALAIVATAGTGLMAQQSSSTLRGRISDTNGAGKAGVLVAISNPENSKHFVGGGTGLTGWVGAAVPTGEMRC